MTTTKIKNRVQSLDKVVSGLWQLKRIHGTWRKVSVALGAIIPAGTLCAIAKGREPHKPIYRRVLGLDVEMIPAPACTVCGDVHVSRRCPSKRKPATRWADMPASRVKWAIENRHE